MKTFICLSPQHRLDMVNAEMKAGVGTIGFSIRLLELRKQRAALEAEIQDELEDELMFASERGAPDMDGCEEYARRFGAV